MPMLDHCIECDKPAQLEQNNLCGYCQNIEDQKKMVKTSNIGVPMDVLDRDRERRINELAEDN